MASTATPFDYVQFMKYGGGGPSSAPASREASTTTTTTKRATYRNQLRANHIKVDKDDVEYVGSGTEQSEVHSEKFEWSDTDDVSSPPPRKRTKRERNGEDFGSSVRGTKPQPQHRSKARRWNEEEDQLLLEGYAKFLGSSAIYAELARYIAQETVRKRGDVRSRARTLANTHPALKELIREQSKKVRGGSR